MTRSKTGAPKTQSKTVAKKACSQTVAAGTRSRSQTVVAAWTRSQTVVAAGLLAAVCISKHVILLNEEILVLLSFLAFLAFCSHTLAETTQATLQARTDTTLRELQQYLQTQRDTAQELHAYHTLSLSTRASFEQVSSLVCAELQATAKAGHMVQTLCVNQARARADALVAHHASFLTGLHTALRASFRACATA